MKKRNVTYHAVNPYLPTQQTQQGVLFMPDNFPINLILTTLSPIALRVMLYAMANIQPDGRVRLEPQLMKRHMRTHNTYVSTGIRDLVKFNLLARQTMYDFWLSPRVARPITLQLS